MAERMHAPLFKPDHIPVALRVGLPAAVGLTGGRGRAVCTWPLPRSTSPRPSDLAHLCREALAPPPGTTSTLLLPAGDLAEAKAGFRGVLRWTQALPLESAEDKGGSRLARQPLPEEQAQGQQTAQSR